MKRILFLLSICFLMVSCTTQQLTIYVNKDKTYKGNKDTLKVTYTQNVHKQDVVEYVKTEKTSTIKNISYTELTNNEIYAYLNLEDGHQVLVSVSNDILKINNIVGSTYTYYGYDFVHTTKTKTDYTKTIENIETNEIISIEQIDSLVSHNKAKRFVHIDNTIENISHQIYQTYKIDEIKYDTKIDSIIEEYDPVLEELQKNGKFETYIYPIKPTINYTVTNIKCIDKRQQFADFENTIYFLKLYDTNTQTSYWVKTDGYAYYHVKCDEVAFISYDIIKHLSNTKKVNIQVIEKEN